MKYISFNNNPNFKLLQSVFSDIRTADDEKYEVGQALEVLVNSQKLGVVKVEAVRQFEFGKLRDVLSYLNCGRSTAYQAKLLNSFYGKGQLLPADFMLCHIVFRYTERNMDLFAELLQNMWHTFQEQQPNYTNNQQLNLL